MIKQRIQRLESLLFRHDRHANSQPPPRPLKTVRDVIDLLEEQAQAIRSDPWSGAIEKARALAYLASIARRTLETGVIADRMEILESILRQRKATARP
jgi:hypothetical protein